MTDTTRLKGCSPFYPGHPVPSEYFVGRSQQIKKIMEKGIGQARLGKPSSFFIRGEYGIGKSSFAGYIRTLLHNTPLVHDKPRVHPIYTNLGGCAELTDVGSAILSATIRSGAYEPTVGEKIGDWLSRYLDDQSILGVSINLDALRQDGPKLASYTEMLDFLKETLRRLADVNTVAIYLALDELSSITSNGMFSHFLKGLVDTNAVLPTPLPLVLVLCGSQENWQMMAGAHPPIARIFSLIDIDTLSLEETQSFFLNAFGSVEIRLDNDALHLMAHYAAGYPKIMQEIGDSAFWLDEDGYIDLEDASKAIVEAAEEFGRKYVDQQVYRAIRSKHYRSILNVIATLRGPNDMRFSRGELIRVLPDIEKYKIDGFIKKMREIGIIEAGTERGEYIFVVRMARLYIWLSSRDTSNEQ